MNCEKMYEKFFVVLGLLIPCVLIGVQSQSETAPRCFQMTWLGPEYTNESIFMNATCSDATKLATGVPCFMPLVVTYDGTRPDYNYIWANHRLNATCTLPGNGVCATYSYYFNGQVENTTSMCTRAVDSNDNAITSGCYTQVNGSYTTRACFCRSIRGGMPCNSSITSALLSAAVVAIGVILMLYKDLVF